MRETHIKTIAQFDCTSDPNWAHSGPFTQTLGQTSTGNLSSSRESACRSTGSLFFPGCHVSQFLNCFFNSRANRSVCKLGFLVCFRRASYSLVINRSLVASVCPRCHQVCRSPSLFSPPSPLCSPGLMMSQRKIANGIVGSINGRWLDGNLLKSFTARKHFPTFYR